MGKPTGFMEYTRKTCPYRDETERVQDFNELYVQCPEEMLKEQGARCMDCGIPYCHIGMTINGMTTGCPVFNLIPEWNDLVYRGLWKEAYKRLAKTNNFPEFTGRVCPAPCEGSCTCGLHGDPVSIKTIEMQIIDRAFEENWVTANTPLIRTGKKVAVIGSGPSGLACADELNKFGHTVTVYERDDRPGGLLMYGIPNMKLDKRVVNRRVTLMEQAGVQFVTNTEAGKDIPAAHLLREYDAVVVCTGATKARELAVKGRDLKGIHLAMEYLKKSTKNLLDAEIADMNPISAKGKDVIIIGGGDTGTDCVATAIRQGCRSVQQLEILPKPPLARTINNPWPEWPKTLKTDYGQQEHIALYGDDPRKYLISTKEFVSDGNGAVSGIRTINIEWSKNESGQFQMKEIIGSEKVYSAQLVLLAMGFTGPEDMVPSELGLQRDARSNIDASFGKFSTNIDKVFCAGDARRGQSLVVHAIFEGRQCANAVNQYLGFKE